MGDKRNEFVKENEVPQMRYCYTCGDQLIPKRWLGYFDHVTGERFQGYDYKCPNKRWWQFSHYEEPVYYQDGLR